MQTQVNPNGSAMGLANQEDSDEGEFIFIPEEPSQTVASTEPPLPKNRRRNKLEDERLQILKTQAKNQEKILETLKRLESNSYKNYQINKNIYELKKKKAELQMKLIAAKLQLTNKRIQEL